MTHPQGTCQHRPPTPGGTLCQCGCVRLDGGGEHAVKGWYVVEVFGAEIGPGELCAVISDALAVHQTQHHHIRVSYREAAT